MNHHPCHVYQQQAIDWNSHGVLQLLEDGNAASALDSFSKAAQSCLMMNHHQDEQSSEETSAGSSSHDSSFSLHWMDCSSSCCPTGLPTGALNHPSHHHTEEGSCASASFLFCRVLGILPTTSTTTATSPVSPSLLGIPILMNLALTCTIAGLQQQQHAQVQNATASTDADASSSSFGFLEMALDLYQKVEVQLEVLQKQPSQSQSQQNVMMLWAMMSNNRACIYHSLRQESMARKHLDQLAYLLQQQQQETTAARSSRMNSLLPPDCLGDLTLNLYILKASHHSTAAAA